MIFFDLETYPIGPKRAPKVVVGGMVVDNELAASYNIGSWATKIKDLEDRAVWFFHAPQIDKFLDLCESAGVQIVAHNAAFDWTCISALGSDFVKRVYGLYRRRLIQCTYLRSLIIFNAKGELKTQGLSRIPLKYPSNSKDKKYGVTSYVGSVYHFVNLDISEMKDHSTQTSYSFVEGLDFSQWPSLYRDYLVQDVEHLSYLYNAQEARRFVRLEEQYRDVDIFKESSRRAAIHFALSLASAWGVKVDGEAVARLRSRAKNKVWGVASELVINGLATELSGRARERARETGRITIRLDNKAIRKRVKACYEARGEAPPTTEKGGVSTSRAALAASGDPLLEKWAEVGDLKTVWSTFIPALEKASQSCGVINTSFYPYSETGRISARNPNLLNPPRSGGIRECIQARPGCALLFSDYEANELRVLAQVLLDFFGRSKLAESYIANPRFDPHTYLAVKRLNMTYEEGMRRKSDRDEVFLAERQLMKCCNFGFPGGMASQSFCSFAKGYGVHVTASEADDLKAFFFAQFPEISSYLRLVGSRVRQYGGQGYLTRVGRLSGRRRFNQLANFYFQGLAAEGGLTAFTGSVKGIHQHKVPVGTPCCLSRRDRSRNPAVHSPRGCY